MIQYFLYTQSIVCATVEGQCLEYLVYITLHKLWNVTSIINSKQKGNKKNNLENVPQFENKVRLLK